MELCLMKEILNRLFVQNWPRKLIALMAAIIVWSLVNQSLVETRTFTNIPVRVIKLPRDKTILGLLPSGYMKYRISITVTGAKSIVSELAGGDMEVVISAEGKKQSWIATIDKKNLFNIHEKTNDWKKNIHTVTANDIYMKMSRLISEEIPLTINPPRGEPPEGYQYLDVWPKYLKQRVSGPEEQITALKQRGLEVTFNLNKITQKELDALSSNSDSDELSFFVPTSWKMVPIPFRGNSLESFNDPRAKLLRIDFLKQELVPLGTELPVSIFFPLKYARTLNPENYKLEESQLIQIENGLYVLKLPLYVRDVSRLFLDTVKNNLLLTVTAVPKSVNNLLSWDPQFIDERILEEEFVKATLSEMDEVYKKESQPSTKYTEQAIRNRFRDYLRSFKLYKEDGTPLELEAQLKGNTVTLGFKKK
jgi:hypothetical protein